MARVGQMPNNDVDDDVLHLLRAGVVKLQQIPPNGLASEGDHFGELQQHEHFAIIGIGAGGVCQIAGQQIGV